jgi:hypothetical protein
MLAYISRRDPSTGMLRRFCPHRSDLCILGRKPSPTPQFPELHPASPSHYNPEAHASDILCFSHGDDEDAEQGTSDLGPIFLSLELIAAISLGLGVIFDDDDAHNDGVPDLQCFPTIGRVV